MAVPLQTAKETSNKSVVVTLSNTLQPASRIVWPVATFG